VMHVNAAGPPLSSLTHARHPSAPSVHPGSSFYTPSIAAHHCLFCPTCSLFHVGQDTPHNLVVCNLTNPRAGRIFLNGRKRRMEEMCRRREQEVSIT
jgi:hypothetical protein